MSHEPTEGRVSTGPVAVEAEAAGGASESSSLNARLLAAPAGPAAAESAALSRALIEQLPLVIYIDQLDELSSSLYISPQVELILVTDPRSGSRIARSS